MKKEEQESFVLKAISELKNSQGQRLFKYRRNYRRYNNTVNIDFDNFDGSSIVGINQYDASPDYNTHATPNINVIQSCIDTLTSKIAQSKVRPFFNVVGGTFDDLQVAKQSQQYFDLFFDKEKVNKKISEAFKNSCIFDTGVIYIDKDNKSIHNVLPHQVYIRGSEKQYGNITRVFFERHHFPRTLLPEEVLKNVKMDNLEYMDYGIYYDTYNHIECHTLNGRINLIKKYESDTIPFVFIHYNIPVSGLSSLSVVDALYTIQQNIDLVMSKISDAMELTPANTIFMPEGSGISPSKMNNKIGQIFQYTLTPNMTGNPVGVVTPAFIDEQYLRLLEMLYSKAYEIVGVSQLSAQSKKPQDLESGVSLATMEDIESERFETQLNQVVQAYVDVAKTCIRIFNPNEDILPASSKRLPIKWKDVVKASDNMVIQYSAADSLSKDPSTKLKQLEALAQGGVIPQSRIGQFMEIPDLETGFNIVNNVNNAIMAIISDCINKNEYDVPEYIPLDALKEEIVNAELSLRALNNEKNKKDIDKLRKLFDTVDERLQEFNTAINDEAKQGFEDADEQLEEEYPDEEYSNENVDIQDMNVPNQNLGSTNPASETKGLYSSQEGGNNSTWFGDIDRQ
ncbi:hypothetical protein [Methanobrevibacter sp.]|uniref:hypothetical protein n=1 Tax=Methanobrevibacter sp. TaxID=66852 RepID=UPI00388CF925